MAELTYRGAIAAAIAQEMDRDPSVVLIGEDVGAAGGVFKLTEGLFDRFGPERVRDTPISEQAIVGAAMGAAMTGLRPIAELMFSDFFAVDLGHGRQPDRQDPLHDRRPGRAATRAAHGQRRPACASVPSTRQSVENWAMAIPGLKVVAPSNPADMKGLLAAAIRDPDPVIVCEHKALFAIKGEVPEGEHVAPLGQAAIVREGTDATIVALAAMVPQAWRRPSDSTPSTASTPRSSTCGRSSRSTPPAVLRSVAKTGRLFTVEENPRIVRLGRGDRVDRRRRGLLQP